MFFGKGVEPSDRFAHVIAHYDAVVLACNDFDGDREFIHGFYLHQSPGGKADHLSQNIGVRDLFHERAMFIMYRSSVIGGFVVALMFALQL